MWGRLAACGRSRISLLLITRTLREGRLTIGRRLPAKCHLLRGSEYFAAWSSTIIGLQERLNKPRKIVQSNWWVTVPLPNAPILFDLFGKVVPPQFFD